MSTRTPEAARARYDELRRMPTARIREVVRRNRRVVDLRGCPKDVLAAMVLQDEFPRRLLAETFGWDGGR
jgi:hypothetical protein